MDEALIARVSEWEAHDWSDQERAALRYADALFDRYQAEEALVAAAEHFSPKELVELGTVIAFNLGFIPLIKTWRLQTD